MKSYEIINATPGLEASIGIPAWQKSGSTGVPEQSLRPRLCGAKPPYLADGEDWQLVCVSMGKNNHRKPGFV